MRRMLPFDYTPRLMDEGLGMQFHPLDGRPLKYLRFDKDMQVFGVNDGGCWNPSFKPFPKIGDGKPHRAGDPFLAHWRYCPFTGLSLDHSRFRRMLEEYFKLEPSLYVCQQGLDVCLRGFETYYEETIDDLVEVYDAEPHEGRKYLEDHVERALTRAKRDAESDGE